MQEFNNPFYTDNYTTQRDILKTACRDHAFFLSRKLDKDQDTILNELTTYIQHHPEEFVAKKAKILVKDKEGDKEVKIIPIDKVFNYVFRKNYHFSPSMVAYTNSDEKESVNALGTRSFVDNRNKYKKLREKAIEAGDKDLIVKFDKLQNAFKIFNNAQSGAMSTGGTPIHNPSGHTTLTSTCRVLVSTVNLINEQFLSGNRIYSTPQVTVQSITARILATDLKLLDDTMEKYQLYKPTPDDLMDVIKKNIERYWESSQYLTIIEEYVQKLTYLELAAVVYTLDLVSLYRLNPVFMTRFFDEWTHIPDTFEDTLKIEDGDDYTLCISKYLRKPSEEELVGLNYYNKQIEKKYEDFIKVFFRSSIPPTNIFDVNTVVRECVLTSDTDSSIYTVDKLMDTYSNDPIKRVSLSSVLTYFIRKISLDQHRQISINMNVALRNQHLLEMKNEFYFSGYITTLMSKHYYTLKMIVEGVVMKEPEMLTKGVHLRSAQIAKDIKDHATKLMAKFINALITHEKLDPAEELHAVADLEQSVIQDLKNGNWMWLGRKGVKAKARYKLPMSSSYFYHEMWERTFAGKYGSAPDLPYLGIKINVDLGNKTKIKNFIESIEDKGLAERIEKFITETGRDKFDNIIVPMERLSAMNDIPKEIKDVMDIREIIKQNFKSIYAVLESVGLYFLNADGTRLVSDEHGSHLIEGESNGHYGACTTSDIVFSELGPRPVEGGVG